MIISGGVNIYPAEIEGVLITHPKVRDVAVFGVPDDDWGEQVKAVVELAAGASRRTTRVERSCASFCTARAGQAQAAAHHRLHRRAAARPQRQALQAQAARPVLAGSRSPNLTLLRRSARPE